VHGIKLVYSSDPSIKIAYKIRKDTGISISRQNNMKTGYSDMKIPKKERIVIVLLIIVK